MVVAVVISVSVHALGGLWLRSQVAERSPPWKEVPPWVAGAVEFQVIHGAAGPELAVPRAPVARVTPAASRPVPARAPPVTTPQPPPDPPAGAGEQPDHPGGASAQEAASADQDDRPGPGGPAELEPAASGQRPAGSTGGTAGASAGAGGVLASGAAAGEAPSASGGAASLSALLASRLSEAAQRCYPAAAARFRLTGEVQLSFCLREDGQASSVRVARSSGAEVLDQAAAGCVLPGALPFPGAAGCYELPVRFAARAR